MSADPVLVEVFRGAHVESRHRAAVAVFDADGGRRLSLGDVARPVFPRSAVKLIQALPLVESGAADALGLTEAELALAGASHNGEPRHVETAAAMLARVGRDATCLVCGAHWPLREEERAVLWREGRSPTRLHNNCSGKHAGFVCFAVHAGIDPAGYGAPDHPVQRTIASTLADVTGVDVDRAPRGGDGCSIPTWALPVEAMALGFARLVAGVGIAPSRARAARRLVGAALAEPGMVAGTGRFCTDFMTAIGGAAYVKTGAEGVFCAALPGLGLGVALKCEDGAGRASEVLTATVVAELLGRRDDPALARFLAPPVTDWNGAPVGRIAAAEALVSAFTA